MLILVLPLLAIKKAAYISANGFACIPSLALHHILPLLQRRPLAALRAPPLWLVLPCHCPGALFLSRPALRGSLLSSLGRLSFLHIQCFHLLATCPYHPSYIHGLLFYPRLLLL